MDNIPILDLKDRKILTILDWDARTQNSKIAKVVGLSKKSVEYRIKKLENEGFIQRYYPLINFQKLGYYVRRVELVLTNLNEHVKRDIEEYIAKDDDLAWAIWFRGGTCDLGLDIWSNSFVEFRRIYNRFFERFGPYIKKRRFSTSIGFEQYPYSFILGKKRPGTISIMESKDKVEIDTLDKKILLELTKNARKSASDIGRDVGCSYKTVIYRLNELKRKEVYLGARAFINEALLGYNYYKILLYFNHYDNKIYSKIRKYFKDKIETVYIVDHIDSDLDVEVMLKSEDNLFSLLDKVNEDFPGLIKDAEYWVFYKTIKVVYLPNVVQ